MKKFFSIVFALALTINIASAEGGNLIKNFNAYKIVNQNIREVAPVVKNEIAEIGDANTHKIPDVENAWYYTNSDGETYYVRFYPADKDTDVYVVANEDYSKTNNELTKFASKHGYRLVDVDDNEALKEYRFDFYELARKDELGGFFISPDCIKPLKTGMSKINEKMSKNSEKNAVIPYSEDNEPIDLTLVDSLNHIDNIAQVEITVNEYRLKNKGNKYVHGFEYLVKNIGTTDVIAQKITCERLASTKDIATESFVDLDRMDLIDTVGTFPPVLIATGGISALCSVPNWVRLAKTTGEATRFAKALPENYDIKAGKAMRILCMKYKNNKKPLNFVFNRQGEAYNISF